MTRVAVPAGTVRATPSAPPPPTARGTRKSRRGWLTRGPILPALIVTVLVTQLPFLVTLIISFQHWNVLESDETGFVFLDNYVKVLSDPSFLDAIWNSIVMTVCAVLISIVVGLGFAMLLNQRFFGRGLARTLMIIPFLITPVAAALVWKFLMYNPTFGLIDGVLGWFGGLFGVDSPQIDWVSQYPMAAVVIALSWQWIPFEMLILLAGVQSQSLDSMEAARVDGAGPWKIFRYLTIPHLRPYLELGGLLGVIYIVQAFDVVYTITSGGPGTATTNLPYKIYTMVFREYDYGQASAAGVLVVIVSIVVATLALRTVSTLLKEDGR
jgi:sorbitol/mannitol transport system permease protein